MSERDSYRELGLSPGASLDEVKEAYRRLAKQYHPDAGGTGISAKRFARVTEAYRTLSVRSHRRTLVDFPVRDVREQRPDLHVRNDLHSLGTTLSGGDIPSVRAFAAAELGRSGKKTAYAYLRKALFDNDEIVVRSAVQAVGNLRVRQAAGELGVVFNNGKPAVKLAVLDAVGQIGMSSAFRGILMAGLRDPDPQVRRRSLSLYARSNGIQGTHRHFG
jgi:hypothetical protein